MCSCQFSIFYGNFFQSLVKRLIAYYNNTSKLKTRSLKIGWHLKKNRLQREPGSFALSLAEPFTFSDPLGLDFWENAWEAREYIAGVLFPPFMNPLTNPFSKHNITDQAIGLVQSPHNLISLYSYGLNPYYTTYNDVQKLQYYAQGNNYATAAVIAISEPFGVHAFADAYTNFEQGQYSEAYSDFNMGALQLSLMLFAISECPSLKSTSNTYSPSKNIAGISKKQAKIIQTNVEKIPGYKRAGAYGSRTKGTHWPGSDVDIEVRVDPAKFGYNPKDTLKLKELKLKWSAKVSKKAGIQVDVNILREGDPYIWPNPPKTVSIE